VFDWGWFAGQIAVKSSCVRWWSGVSWSTPLLIAAPLVPLHNSNDRRDASHRAYRRGGLHPLASLRLADARLRLMEQTQKSIYDKKIRW
jgi:hypothetical protein